MVTFVPVTFVQVTFVQVTFEFSKTISNFEGLKKGLSGKLGY